MSERKSDPATTPSKAAKLISLIGAAAALCGKVKKIPKTQQGDALPMWKRPPKHSRRNRRHP